ncbi:hypothetical protein HXZ66_01945 [Bacillus sp. A116_S68]|nr:hypothetical protein HXZ66_01945 [Bacillus sp. A116_S68]
MAKKFKVILAISVLSLVIGALSMVIFIEDDYVQIEEEVQSLQQFPIKIAHIEIIDNYAIVFFEWTNKSHAGVIELKKGWFGWNFLRSASERVDDREQFIALSRFSIIQQRASLEVETVMVELQNGETHSAPIVQGEDTYRRWIYYSETEDLAGAIVTTYDKNGDKFSEVKMPDEPNKGLNRTIE